MSFNRQQLLKIKHSKFRNTVASCLLSWKKDHSINNTFKKLNISRPTVIKSLLCSRFFRDSKYNIYKYGLKIESKMNTKRSKYRNKIAFYQENRQKAHGVEPCGTFLTVG